jgi:toxin ParE1/3/4
MPHTINKTPLAAADLIDIASFIAEDNLDAAERFLDAAEATFTNLASMPLMGRTVPFQHPQAQVCECGACRGLKTIDFLSCSGARHRGYPRVARST